MGDLEKIPDKQENKEEQGCQKNKYGLCREHNFMWGVMS